MLGRNSGEAVTTPFLNKPFDFGGDFDAVGRALGGNSVITSLSLIEIESFEFVSAAPVTHGLKTSNSKHLKEAHFEINGGMDEEFYDGLAATLLINESLEKLTLCDHFQGDNCNWLAAPVLALQSNKTLKSLKLEIIQLQSDSPTHTPVLGKALVRLLANNHHLESLQLDFDKVSANVLVAMMSSLSLNTGLKSFDLRFGKTTIVGRSFESCSCEKELLSALETNSSLETLCLTVWTLPHEEAVRLAAKIAAYSRLKHLQIKGFGETSIYQHFDLLLSSMGTNFNLETIDVALLENHKKEIGIILRLNAAGRRYLIEDSSAYARVCKC